MPSNMLISLLMDSAGIVLLFTMIIPFLNNRRQGGRWLLLSAAALLHFVALGFKITAVLLRNANVSGQGSAISALVFDSVSVLVMIWFVLSDSDGALRFKNRTEPVSAAMVVAAVLPSLLALGVEQITGGSILGFSYAVSMQLATNLLFKTTEKNIAYREEKLGIEQSKVLMEQMHPHFIFNSLMAIEELCYIDPDIAAGCIENLSGYLRGNIDALTSNEPIPFGTELKHIEQYVYLEQADPDRVFTVEYDLQAEEFSIPALTVQPIVENAIKHGALTRRDGSGVVCIKTEEVGDFIRITVTDNGIGEADKTNQQKDHEGVGIKNVRERLRTQCGGMLSTSFSENGSRAVITIPKKG